jgi:hypothetical protein
MEFTEHFIFSESSVFTKNIHTEDESLPVVDFQDESHERAGFKSPSIQ